MRWYETSTSEGQAAMLVVEDLKVSYGTAVVLDGVSIEVRDGEAVALLGRNGMGKTTLCRAVSGVRPPMIGRGRIVLGGTDTTTSSSLQIARLGLGLVPQGRRVFGSLTVEENLQVVAKKPAPDQDAAWDLDGVYDFFPRLRERRLHWSRVLSGGEQQMLAIGRALMTNPRLLVMDEPSEGLAPTVLDTIQDRLHLLCERGLSILLAEQNVDLALEIASSVAILGDGGTVAWQGPTSALQQDSTPVQSLLGI